MSSPLLDYLILREGWQTIGSDLTRAEALILMDMVLGKPSKKESRKLKTAKQRIRRRLKRYRGLIESMADISLSFYFPLPHRRPPAVMRGLGHGADAYEFDLAKFYVS